MGRRSRSKLGGGAYRIAVVAALVLASGASCSSSSEKPPASTVPPAPPPTTAPAPSVAATRPPAPPATTTTVAPVLRTEPAPGGSIRVALDHDFLFGYVDVDGTSVLPTLNPLLDSGSPEIGRLVVPGAYRIDAATGELLPWLVEEIPRLDNGGVVVAEDGSVSVTYTVREEAVWEDGTPVTGADLAFTHGVVMSIVDRLPADGRLRRAHELIETVAADGKTLTATLTRPSPDYEMLFEWVLPAHLIDPTTFLEDWNDRLWPSAGPFRFVSFDQAASPDAGPSVVVVERNTAYWETDPGSGDALPYLDRIEILAVLGGAVDPAELNSSVAARTFDAGLGFLFPAQYLAPSGTAVEGLETPIVWDVLYELLAFNFGDARFAVNPNSLNEHLEYRQAVLSAIDRKAVADATGELAMSSILGAALPDRDHDAWTGYDDPTRTGELLAALGAELGRDLADRPASAVYVTSDGDVTMRIGDAAVNQLEAAGIDATAEYGDFFGVSYPQGLYDLMAVRQFAGVGGLSGVAQVLAYLDPFAAEPLADWSSVGEPARRYSEIMAEAATELDTDELAALLVEAETILAEQAVVYPLIRRQGAYRPYWSDRVQGIVPSRFQGWDTWNAAWWWSPAG